MGKLSDNFKHVPEGFAYQDVADYLTTHQKLGAPRDCVRGHPSLICLMATAADELVRELAERIPCSAGVKVSLALIGGHAPPKSSAAYAAWRPSRG